VVGDLAHAIRPTGGEHLEADFDPTNLSGKGAQERLDNARGWFVENEDEIAGHGAGGKERGRTSRIGLRGGGWQTGKTEGFGFSLGGDCVQAGEANP
jgi:hypothetical protein